ncbi:oxidoreductase [Streptomyces sp. NPDC087422]|uniref:oxidoreductase n=1 Tax=Streptomyces sp. NPDC087422 TaxID=3365786 RepID=UPI0037F2D93B
MSWTAESVPDQSGRTAVVTGANTGIGYCTARELARRGARVTLACRDAERATAALKRLQAEVPNAQAVFRPLDLADLESVRAFAEAYEEPSLDLLVNNAGVMALPYGLTYDGFEKQFGVNHLGHFALTGLLLPRLRAADRGARIVVVSSVAHVLAGVRLGDLNATRGYRRWTAYGQSKSANLLFVHELSRRLAAAGSGIVAAAAHPGYAATDLHTRGALMEGRRGVERVYVFGNRLLAQSAERGALPTLYAATAPGVAPDSFTGPRAPGLRGAPARAWRLPRTRDDVTGELLWEASERLTGVTYAL